MSEEFFNVEFWRSLVAVALGALLGFGAALAVGLELNRRRRSQYAKTVRNAIATECIYNLIALNEAVTQVERTVKDRFTTLYVHRFPPRGGILQRLVTPEVLGSLSSGEMGSLVVVAPELENARSVYDAWKQMARSPTVHPRTRFEETNHCLHMVTTSGRNVLGLLIEVCQRSSGRELRDENARRMADKLASTKTRPVPNFVRGLKSSHGKSENLDELMKKRRYLVVWEHDWPECPMNVVELRKCLDPTVIRYSA